MKWRVVGFDHPNTANSVMYRQNLTDEQLLATIRQSIAQGCNLFSVRGIQRMRVSALRELSREVCHTCSAGGYEDCADCTVHRLINQLLRETT